MTTPPFKSSAKSARRIALALLGVLAVVTAVAIAAPSVPAPSITAKPANPTASTSASFSFTGAPTGGSYQCSLDGSTFAACTSGKTYTGLTSGSHTFRVLAVDKSKKLSDPASYTWTVDATPPVVSTINRAAANPTNAPSVEWAITFSEPVIGVDAADFTLVKSGISGGSTAITISGSGASYVATMASTGTGNGTVGLNLVDNDSIKDALNNALGGNGAGNGNKTGQAYTIDRTPPAGAPTITAGPSGLINSASATLRFSSSEAGVTSFRCQIDNGPETTCSSPATFDGLADGERTFKVRAADAAGNVGAAAATRTWTIDTVAPPAPVIGDKPEDPNGDGIANFDWTVSESPVTFRCSIENKQFESCASPYRTVVDVSSDRQHHFAVRAYDAAGNYSEATYQWKVLRGVNVTIDGNVVGALAPGLSQPIAMTVHNPNNFEVKMVGLEVSVGSSPQGCPAGSIDGKPANITLTQTDVTANNTLIVPANGKVTLPAQDHPAPQIRMNNTPFNQDACKGGTFGLKYVGWGVK